MRLTRFNNLIGSNRFPDMARYRRHKALPIAIMFALFFIIAFVTGLQNPMGVIIRSQTGATNLLSQLGNLANFIAYAFMGVPAGIMLQRIGYKKTSLYAVGTGLAGVSVMWIAGRMGSYGIYLAGAFISGFSMCMLNTVVNPMLKSLGKNDRQGNQLIQFGGAFNSIGATLAPVLVGYLMGNNETVRTIASADPALYIAAAIFVVSLAVIAVSPIPEPYEAGTARETNLKGFRIRGHRNFLLGIIAIFLYTGTEVGIPNIGNLYMTSHLGMESSVAGTIVGTYWLLMLAGRLAGGAIGGRVGSRTMLVFTAALGVILVTGFIATQGLPLSVNIPVFRSDLSFATEPVALSLLFLILCGLATSVMWGSIFSLATKGLGTFTSAASGIFMTMVCGGGIMPALQAWIADKTTYAASFGLVLLSLAYIFFYAVAAGREKAPQA